MKTVKTNKGTELPLLNLKGKDYLQAQHRVVWFREEKPEWSIETEIISHSPEHSLCRATIRNESGRIIAQASKEETKQGFPDHLEKAETGAIARALSLCGFGTAFAQELDEGARLADSPSPQAAPQLPASTPRHTDKPHSADGSYVFTFGKHLGKRLDELDVYDLDSYQRFIRSSAERDGKEITGKVSEALAAIDAFLDSRDVTKRK